MNSPNQRVLFLCTGNSCRSQMGEGLLRRLAGERVVALSAGAKPSGFVHPIAIAAMCEIGIDISAQRSKSVEEFLPPHGRPPDVIISVCDSAAEECPNFLGNVERLHWPFENPADVRGTEDQRLAIFRRVRDQMRSAIEGRFCEKTTETGSIFGIKSVHS